MALLLLSAFPIVILLAALSDLASMTIPNRLVAILVVIFPLYALAAGWPLSLAALHAATGIAVLLVTFGCFAAGWMGGGDAKLLAAVALWLGPTTALSNFAIWTAVLGGVLTLALLIARARLSPTTGHASVDHLLRADTGIPYGVAIAAAGLLVTPALIAATPL